MLKKSKIILLIVLSIISISLGQAGAPKQQTYQINWNNYPKFINNYSAFIIQQDKTIQQSTDGGFTWTKMNGLKVQDIIVDNVDNNLVLFKGPNNGNTVQIWRSTNGGNTTQSYTLSYPLSRIAPHPTKSSYLLAVSGKRVYLSQNFGLEWKAIFNNFNLYSTQGIAIAPVWDTTTQSIYAILVINSIPTLVVTTDFGNTYKSLLPNALNVISTYNYIYAGTYNQTNGDLNLYTRNTLNPISNSVGGFGECEFPFGDDIQPNDYRIVDDSNGAIWLGVVLKQSSYWGSMFVSDASGTQFTEVMKHVNLGQAYDFTPFYGLRGTFISNNLTNYNAAPSKPTLVQTLISYDNGGEWSVLAPPAGGACQGCSLNVHGISAFADEARGYGPFYSIPNAPGIAIATGTVNPYLSSKPTESNIKTFFTNDAGKTWTKILDTGSIYEFGNYGNFIVAANCLVDTNIIQYSIDQGTTWKTLTLTGTYDIINIVTVPDNSGMKFVLTAQDSNDNGVIIALDFSQVGYPTCSENDYQDVDITSNTASGCILGELRTYKMRLPTSSCLVGNAAVLLEAPACDCTVDDFECDLGYIEDPLSTTTDLICAVDPNYVGTTGIPSVCPADTQYPVSKGFRKIAGTACKNGVESQYAPTMMDCPGTVKHKSKGWVAGLVIGLLVAGAAGFTFYLYRFNPELKEKIRKRLGFHRGPKYSVVGIRPNSLNDDEFGIEDDDAQILNDNDLQDNNF